ncbi:GAP family protein [Kitasatospora sp. NPDC050543]|uniref:GAP family protein n=1 Tax=Kitasatospora sp. NPDC050543 TaxID=3364054 RepID=UPI0037B4957F
MVLDLLLIGTAISLGPIHNSAFILLLSSDNGVRKGLAFVLAWLANLVVVIACVELVTGGTPPARNSAPSTAVVAFKLALGVALVLFGERKRRAPRSPRKTPKWMAKVDRASVWAAAGLAVLLQPWGLVGAGAATAVDADLSSIQSYLALSGYCLLATLSLLVMEVYVVWAPVAARAKLGGLRSWMDSHQDQVVVTLLLLIGLLLMGKSIYQLVS